MIIIHPLIYCHWVKTAAISQWYFYIHFLELKLFLIYPPSTKLKVGYTGFTSIRLSVRLWTESCPLCNFHNISQIHFIFTHLIKQLQKVCQVLFIFAKFQNLSFWQIFQICNLNFVMFWLGIWNESIVWVIMGECSQNAVVLVVLVWNNVLVKRGSGTVRIYL